MATNKTKAEVVNARIFVGKIFIFKKFPICPPINTAISRGQ